MMALLKKTLLFFLKVRIIPTFPFSNIGTIFRLIFPWIKYWLKNLTIFCHFHIAIFIIKSIEYDNDRIEDSIKAILCVHSMSHTNIKTRNRECSWMWKKLEPPPYNFYYETIQKMSATVYLHIWSYYARPKVKENIALKFFLLYVDSIFRLLWYVLLTSLILTVKGQDWGPKHAFSLSTPQMEFFHINNDKPIITHNFRIGMGQTFIWFDRLDLTWKFT